MAATRLDLPVDDPAVDAVTAEVQRPARTARRTGRSILLAPGAGGDLDGAGLRALADQLVSLGCTVVRANLPYRQAGRRAPRADRSVPGYLDVLAAAREAVGDERPWVLGGKSYGGRVASMAVAEGATAAGLILYGYPLHPPGKPEKLRVDHWPDVHAPALFLQGDRDSFCDLSLMDRHVLKFPRRATVRVVPGGDHSLHVTRAASPTGEASPPATTIASLRGDLAAWLRSLEA
jgi:uncharacterized protein